MKNVKVSIIVPVYNVEKYLRECLDSICAQTHTNLEIICVNDGSTDACGRILDEYASRDARMQVVHKENAGYGHAVNVGLDLAKGKYVQVVEPDDYIHPNMTGTLVEISEKYQLDLIKADYYIFVGEGEERTFQYNNIAKTEYYNKVVSAREDKGVFENRIYTWAGIFNREFIEKNNIRHHETPGASFQDVGFWFQTIALAERVMYVNQPFYHLRRDNPGSSFFNTNKIDAKRKEYDFVKAFIMQRLSSDKRYLQILNRQRLKDYCHSVEKMDWKYRDDFHEKVRRDILREKEEGNIGVSLFSAKERVKYDWIINDNMDWIYCSKVQVTRNKWEQLKQAEAIIIYGAGKVGQRLADIYKEEGLSILGFAVSECPEVSQMDTLPVRVIEEWKNEQPNAIIVVAVGEKLQGEIVENLRRKDISNFITLD